MDNGNGNGKHVFFTVIITSFNRPDMLERAVASVELQTVENWEIIVIDDGSSLCYRRFETRPGIRYYRNRRCKGVASSRNSGVEVAQGEWVVFLDDDDEFAQDYLEVLKHRIDNNLTVGFFWSDVKFVTARATDGNGLSSTHMKIYDSTFAKTEHLYKSVTETGAGFGLAINRNIYLANGGFDPTFVVGEDTEFFIRLLSAGVVPKPANHLGVIKHEEHEDRLSGAGYEKYSSNRVYERIFRLHKDFFAHYRFNHMHLLRWTCNIHVSNRNIRYAFLAYLSLFHITSLLFIEEKISSKLLRPRTV